VDFIFKNIAYSKVGTGPHLCFLHGFCEDSTIWQSLADTLRLDYTVICVDLPGFGKSSDLSFGTLNEVAKQINELLKAEDIQRCILLGHSMGGYIAAAYAALFPSELKALALVHSTALADGSSKEINRQKSIDFIVKNGSQEFFRLFISGLVALEHRGRLREQLTALITQTSDRSILAGLSAMKERPSHLETIAQFHKPILFIKGEEDTHYSADEIYTQAAAASICQLSMLQDVGHLSMLENPEKCLMEVQRFLKFCNAFTPSI